MKVGKLSQKMLDELILDRIKCRHSEVVCGAGIGEDCAVLKFDGEYCVLSTDPITAASDGISKLCVHINANDVASSGAEPIAMLVTILIPPESSYDEVKKVIDELIETAEHENIDIVGGHTEVTDAVKRLIVSATVLGKTAKPLKTAGGEPGHALIMSKFAGIEGTKIICGDYKELAGVLDDNERTELETMGDMLSVVEESRIASKIGVSAMHDITEGGVLGAVYEMSRACGCGAVIDEQSIPVKNSTRKLCSKLGINVLRLISSGSMLIACEEEKVSQLLTGLEQSGIHASRIGMLMNNSDIMLKTQTGLLKIDPPGSDEIYKVVSRFGEKG